MNTGYSLIKMKEAFNHGTLKMPFKHQRRLQELQVVFQCPVQWSREETLSSYM